jgi:alkanesulfonate monooxygenase SsuD/methylene tetrahydromethanopterin reductase-like flavin-dependent oxidoreductase (luciferase family)
MRIGVQLPEVERVVRRDELAAMARAAEEAGFDSIWIGDHLYYPEPDRGPWDCWTTLSWLAGITERVTLGPLVACTAFHPPGILARQAAAVDELSGGRLVCALGAGWNEAEFRAFGLPFGNHVSRFEEAFTIIRRLLAGERVTYEGRFHEVHDAALYPPPLRTPKLMIGANAPRMLSIALPHVDVWNTWFTPYGNTPEGFAKLNAQINADVERSACVLVDCGGNERRRDVPAVPADALSDHLRALEEAGADEAILVLDPITERSIKEVSDTVGV